jgi:hypothetical protein
MVSRVVVVALPVETVLDGELTELDGAAMLPDEEVVDVVDPAVPAFGLFDGYADGGEVPAL